MKTDYSKRLRSKCSTLVFSIIYDIGCLLFSGLWTGYVGYFIATEGDTVVSRVVLLVLFSVILVSFFGFIQNLIKDIKEYKQFNPVEYLEYLEKLDKEVENHCSIIISTGDK